MPKRTALKEQANRLGAEFLRIDCETGLTFCGIALETNDPEKKKRTYQAARKAYHTIMRLREGIDLLDVERAKLDIGMQRLKSELDRVRKQGRSWRTVKVVGF